MIVPLIIGGITGLLFSDSKKYSNGGGVGEPYDSMTKYQLEKELQKLTDEWFEIRKLYSTDNHPRQVEIDKEKDKIITLLYGENFSGKNQKFKYKDGGNVPEKYQIKKGEKYYSKDLSTGNTKWVNSPDMGYMLTKDEATSIKSILSKEFDNIEVVKYDPDWWKYESGGDISTSVRNKKGEIIYLIEPSASIIYEFGGDVKPVSERKAREMAKKGIYSEISVEFIPNFEWIGKGEKINSSRDSFDFFKELFDKGKLNYREEFIILLLNRNNSILGYAPIGIGSDTATVVDKKAILGIVSKSRAAAVIMCHNHPSGNKNPSNSDLKVTKDVKSALELIDVALLDHIIITRKGVDDYIYTSLADEGHVY